VRENLVAPFGRVIVVHLAPDSRPGLEYSAPPELIPGSSVPLALPMTNSQAHTLALR